MPLLSVTTLNIKQFLVWSPKLNQCQLIKSIEKWWFVKNVLGTLSHLIFEKSFEIVFLFPLYGLEDGVSEG